MHRNSPISAVSAEAHEYSLRRLPEILTRLRRFPYVCGRSPSFGREYEDFAQEAYIGSLTASQAVVDGDIPEDERFGLAADRVDARLNEIWCTAIHPTKLSWYGTKQYRSAMRKARTDEPLTPSERAAKAAVSAWREPCLDRNGEDKGFLFDTDWDSDRDEAVAFALTKIGRGDAEILRLRYGIGDGSGGRGIAELCNVTGRTASDVRYHVASARSRFKKAYLEATSEEGQDVDLVLC